MTKKRGFIIAIISMLVLIAVGYAGLGFYFTHHFDDSNVGFMTKLMTAEKCFMFGTKINGVDVSNMELEETNIKLASLKELPEIKMSIKGDHSFEGQDIDFSYDYTDELIKIFNNQSYLMWLPYYMGEISEINIEPISTYDSSKLADVIKKSGIENKEASASEVYLELTDLGYVIHNDKVDLYDIDKILNKVSEELDKCNFDISLGDEYLVKAEYSDEEQKVLDYYDKEISKLQEKKISYKFGKESKIVGGKEWCELYLAEGKELPEKLKAHRIDNNLNCELFDFELTDDRINKFVESFLDEYNTYHNRYFKTHSGETVYVDYGIYGNKIDLKAEQEWFKEFLDSDKQSAVRNPVYIQEAKYKEKNDFGDTFIEISLDEQHMWYYKDGKLFLDTDVTTGADRYDETRPRVCYVQEGKARNRYLVGPTWRSFVKFWIPVHNSIGIHDASWRSEYGGDHYKLSGSHGCINTPLDQVEKLYENVEIGTPCIIYSIEKNKVE